MPNPTDIYSRHAHYLEQYYNGQADRLMPFLRRIAKHLRLELTKTQTVHSQARIDRLLKFTEDLVNNELTEFNAQLSDQIELFAESEGRFALGTINPDELFDTVMPGTSQLFAAVNARPFNNRLLKDYLTEFSKGQAKMVRDAVSMGFYEGQTTQQIVQGIIGTKSQNYKNGILNVTRTSGERMVRTALSHTAAVAKNKTFEDNSDLIPYYEWVSTLDGRTSSICRSLDSKVFRVGKGRLPPAHFNSCVEGTLITTKRGLIPVEDVCVGDYALTHTGGYRRVNCVMAKQNNTPVKELINNFGERVRLTDDHPVLTSNGWKKCGHISAGDKIFNNCNKLIRFKDRVRKPFVEKQILIDAHNIKTDTTEELIPYNITSFAAGVSSAINFNNNITSNNKIWRISRDYWLKFINKIYNYFVCRFNRHFYNSTIVQIVEVRYIGMDYNLSIDKDETYVADGFLVHNCRSTTSPLFVEDVRIVSGKPIKNDIGGKRASMDGQVSADLNYNDWLAKQSKSFQIDVLGKDKAELFRKGGLTMDKFVNNRGQTLTLKDLKAKYPKSWNKADL